MNAQRTQLLARIEQRLNRNNFTREDSSWVDASLKTIEALRGEGFPDGAQDQLYREEVREFLRGRSGDKLNVRGKGEVVQFRTYSPLGEGTGTAGGDLVPTGFEAAILRAMKRYDQILDCARWLFTPTGNPLNYPSLDDTGNLGVQIAENASTTTQTNPTLANVSFGLTPLYSSQVIQISRQLQQDAGVDLVGLFEKLYGERLARVFAPIATAGLVAAAPSGLTSASSGVVTADDLIGLMGALDSAYAAGASWLMSWATLINVLKIKDSGGRYVFLPLELDAAGHVLLFSRPVFLCQSLPAISAGTLPIYFGDTSYLIVRQAGRQEFLQYAELYMASHQVGFEAFARFDVKYCSPGADSSNPVIALTVHN